jgi:hypothetical protein
MELCAAELEQARCAHVTRWFRARLRPPAGGGRRAPCQARLREHIGIMNSASRFAAGGTGPRFDGHGTVTAADVRLVRLGHHCSLELQLGREAAKHLELSRAQPNQSRPPAPQAFVWLHGG